MAISPNAKRARNTSESEEKILSKKKKHSEGAAESFSSPLLSKGKKGRLSKAGTPNVGEQKVIKSKASIGSKKGGKETQMKSGRKQKTISKGSGKVSKGKKETEDGDEESEEDEGDESEEQESEEGGNEEIQGSDDDSDEEAGENEESDDEAEAEENADSDDDDDGGKEAGGKDSDESDSDDDGGEKKDKKPQFGSRNNEFTLFVTNIPYSAEMDDLKKFFSVAGNVKEVRVPVNNKTGRPRGFAFVCMEDEEAMNAALKLDNEEMEGRPLKVQKSLDGGSGGGGGGRFQRGGGGGRWRGDRGGFRGGRGFSRDRRGGGFGGDRGGRGFDRSRGGFSGERSSSRGFGERSGGRGFGRGGGSGRGGFKGDRDRKGGFERSRGSGRPWNDRDSSSKNSRQSGGDSD